MQIEGQLYGRAKVCEIAKDGGFNLNGTVYCRITLPAGNRDFDWRCPAGCILAMDLSTQVVRIFAGDEVVTPIKLKVSWTS